MSKRADKGITRFLGWIVEYASEMNGGLDERISAAFDKVVAEAEHGGTGIGQATVRRALKDRAELERLAHDLVCTRAPKPPPFPVGTRLRCVRNRGSSWTAAVDNPRDMSEHPEDWVQVSGFGLEVEIAEVKPGRRGTGEQLRDSDGPMFYEDDGQPILDETDDGRSIYYVSAGERGKRAGRLIPHKYRNEWEIIK